MSEILFEDFVLDDMDCRNITVAAVECLNVENIFKEMCGIWGMVAIKLPDDMEELETVIKKEFPRLRDSSLYENGEIGKVGIPDFFIYKKDRYRFVEVKSEHDGIRLTQLRWFKNHPDISKCVTYVINRGVEVEEEGRLTIDEIMAGTTARKMLYVKIMREAIRELIKNPDIDTSQGVHVSDIKREAIAGGIPEDEFNGFFKRLNDIGEIYTPVDGYYRLTK